MLGTPGRSRPSSAWVRVAVAACLGACAGRQGSELEVIARVPRYVLHVEDIEARVHRAPHELGTQLGGVRVAAVLVRVAERCPPQTAGRCAERHVFADPEGTDMLAELVDDPARLEVGRTYVLWGNVEAVNDAPRRWVFKGSVLAVAR